MTATPPDENVSPESDLDDMIATLTWMRESPAEDVDPAEVAGELGLALLQRYETDRSVDTLSTAVDHLREAVTAGPDNADWLGWCFWLGTAYAERGDRCDCADDYDPAVAWIGRARAGLSRDDPDYDRVTLALAEVNADRFNAQQPGDERTIRADLDDLITALDGLTVTAPDAIADLDVLRGLAYLERFDLTEQASDLDEAIRYLDPAVPALPPDRPGRGAAEVALVNAYRRRAVRCAAGGAVDPRNREAVDRDLAAAGRHAGRALRSGDLGEEVTLQLHLLSVTTGSLHLGDAVRDRQLSPLNGADQSLMPPDQGLVTEVRQRIAAAGEALTQTSGADPEVRAELAFELVVAANRTVAHDVSLVDNHDTGQVREWLALAAEHPDPPREWPAAIDLLTGSLNLVTGGQRPAGDIDAADYLVRAKDGLGQLGSPEGQQDLTGLLTMALISEASRTDERRGLGAASGLLGTQSESALAEPESKLLGLVMSAAVRGRQGDRKAFVETVERITALLHTIPTSAEHAVTTLPLVRALQQAAGVPVDGSAPALPELPAHLAGTGHALASRLLLTAADATQAANRGDVSVIRSGARRLAELADRARPGHIVRFLGAMVAAQAHRALARRDPSDRAAAEAAVRWYEEAVGYAEHESHPLWPELAMGLAESLRLAGAQGASGSRAGAHLARSRQLGLSALRGHAWRVLRQAGTGVAVGTARTASTDAHTVAHWCLADDATDDLVVALESGRGLVLDAATVSRDVPARLEARGHHDLAAQWRATAGLGRDRLTGAVIGEFAPDQIPDDLRLRALRALRTPAAPLAAAADAPTAPLASDETIQVGEIPTALTSLGADALVYLVPAGAGAGAAIVVPVTGPVETISLPGLDAGPDSPVSRYAGPAHAARDADAARPSPTATSLDELCRWAWDAAIGPLIQRTRRWHLLRPARLVLVATGALGLVPWQAAHTTAAGQRRYALGDLVISYAVSARMLCRIASRPRREVGAALVVGDPGGDLPYAGAEACAIHRCFYPDGTYLGQPAAEASGAGTAAQVRDWIEHASGPSLVHLACHGHVDPHYPDTSHLVLAGGQHLLARDLLAAARLSPLGIGTAFLAACSTNLSGEDYDEAFSLATTFLAAGASTVFGSLWRVPDSSTSLLMFMLHHYLNVERLPPADALRQAQQWMLDRDRQPPDGMPPDLAGRCSHESLADPVSWAGFTHLGR